jgi:DNA primase
MVSGRIPQSFIDDLIARVDIVDLIDSRVPLKKTGSNFMARCPFHSEKTPSFSVSREKQFYYCFGCGASGTAIGFLMDYDHLGFVEAVEELAESVGLDVPRETGTPGKENRTALLNSVYDLQNRVAVYYAEQLRNHPQAHRAIDYLKGRGLSGEVARRYGIGYAPPGWNNLAARFDQKQLLTAGLLIEKDTGKRYDRFRDRIMFPIRDRRARVVGFGGRVLDQGTPKYLNSPETSVFQKGREVYGLAELLRSVSKPERILVVEGYMDVIALAQCGIPYAVATLGTATSKDHLDLLFRLSSEVVICFDGDRAGRQAAWRAVETALPCLREGRQIRLILLPDGQDPDSIVRQEGRERFEEDIANAVLMSDYFFRYLTDKLDLTTIEGRASLVKTARPLISKLPKGTFRQMMQARLSELAHIDMVENNVMAAQPVHRSYGNERRSQVQSSPIRVAIALLLQHPELARNTDLESAEWAVLESKGVVLLKKITQILKEQPNMPLGGLLERFRGKQEEQRYIQRLALWRLPIPDEGVNAEFTDALSRIGEHEKNARMDRLLQKESVAGLTETEKQKLRQLLSEVKLG